MTKSSEGARKKVVIVGGGFGGLTCAQGLAKANVDITLVDRTNHHLFQPLLYQVAIAGLSPAEIAAPIRGVLSGQKNARVLLGSVAQVHLSEQRVELDDGTSLPYDHLVLAVGAKTSYFGHEEWEKDAPGLKSLGDALEIRHRVLLAFEQAERESDPKMQKELLTFVVIGGGPTGVELAGAIAELAHVTLDNDFRAIDPDKTQVILVEAGPTVLSPFTTGLQERAREQLKEIGVQIRVGQKVTTIDAQGVVLDGKERITARTVLWAAGVRGTRLAETLGVPLDRQGRVIVESDTAVPGHPNAFAIGDMAACPDGKGTLPGLCPVAMQQGRYVAEIIGKDRDKDQREPFKYIDKGTMATIGRSRAIAQAGRMQMSGFLAWLAWLFVHIMFLIGFRNRFVVLFTWAWSYFSFQRGARLITMRHTDSFGRNSKPERS
jgi:NADH dehydrogenase